MAGSPDSIVIGDVAAVSFDLLVRARRFPPGILESVGDDRSRTVVPGSTVRALCMKGRFDGRDVQAMCLFRHLGEYEITCDVVFTDDSLLLSRLREGFAFPAVWARIKWEKSKISVEAELFGEAEGQEDSQVAEAAQPDEVIAFEFTATGRKTAGVPTTFGVRQLFQIRDAERPALARTEAITKCNFGIGSGNSEPLWRTAKIKELQVKGGRNLDIAKDLGFEPSQSVLVGWAAEDLEITLGAVPNEAPVVHHRAFHEPRMDPRTPPPYVFDDVVSTGFKFTANREHLDAIVDALLNAPEAGPGDIARQNFRYVAASTEIVLEYLEYGSMRSTAPETSERRDEDFTSQFELCLRLIVGAIEEDSEAASDPMVFCPVLFVDNWTSMVSGREVMGYWKRMAAFEPARGTPNAEALRERLWPHARFDVTEEGQADVPRMENTDDVERRITAAGYGEPIVTIRHALDRAALRPDHRNPGRLGVGDAQRLLPWRQTDFGDVRFRRQFARDWLRVSGESFDTIQRSFLAGPNGRAPYGGWIRTRNTVRDFRVVQPEGAAVLTMGSFVDRELAVRLGEQTVLAGAIGKAPVIDLAKLLGLPHSEIKIPPSDWYLASGSFDVKVIDRLA